MRLNVPAQPLREEKKMVGGGAVGGEFLLPPPLYSSGPPWIGWCPPTLGRSIYFTQFIDLNANLIWKHLSKTHPG